MKSKNLGQFEMLAMQAVLQRGNDAYGLQIQDELKKTVGREVTLGAIYTTLARLEEHKLVTSRLADSQSDRLGRPRRYFQITGAGMKSYDDSRDALQRIAFGLKPAHELGR